MINEGWHLLLQTLFPSAGISLRTSSELFQRDWLQIACPRQLLVHPCLRILWRLMAKADLLRELERHLHPRYCPQSLQNHQLCLSVGQNWGIRVACVSSLGYASQFILRLGKLLARLQRPIGSQRRPSPSIYFPSTSSGSRRNRLQRSAFQSRSAASWQSRRSCPAVASSRIDCRNSCLPQGS